MADDEVVYEIVPGDDGRAPLVFDDSTSCFFCTTAPAVWARPLDPTRLTDADGDGYTLGGPLTLCGRCETLFADGAFDVLRQLALDSHDIYRDLSPSLRRAAGPAYRLRHYVEDPAVTEALSAGFVDLDAHTGAHAEVGPRWPAEHRVARPDGRPNRWQDGDRWLVRSPWPSLSVDDVLDVLWRWVERGAGRHQDAADDRVRTARITEVFGWADEHARAVLDGPDPREER